MTFITCVFNEALRRGGTAPNTHTYFFKKDTKVGWMNVKAYQTLQINIHGLHMNKEQWQRPEEFLPDRFDPSHPLSKTASGQKRHPQAFLPFSAGSRVCFGKNFAELHGTAVLTMFAQRFDMSFVDKELYNADNLPLLMITQSHNPPLWLELKERK